VREEKRKSMRNGHQKEKFDRRGGAGGGGGVGAFKKSRTAKSRGVRKKKGTHTGPPPRGAANKKGKL